MRSQEYPVVGFFSDTEISGSLLFPRKPLRFAIVVNDRPTRIELKVSGCRWEQNPHGGDEAEEMLIVTGKDQHRGDCELQLSFREIRARLAYNQQE